jgi:hypothetical protein
MIMVGLVLEKQPMIFIFGKMASHQDHEGFDKRVDLETGETGGEKVGKFWSSGQLEKTGQGFPVKLTGEAETYLVWLDSHGVGKRFINKKLNSMVKRGSLEWFRDSRMDELT